MPQATSASTGSDALSPLRFPPDLQITPEQFAQVCAENRDSALEAWNSLSFS